MSPLRFAIQNPNINLTKNLAHVLITLAIFALLASAKAIELVLPNTNALAHGTGAIGTPFSIAFMQHRFQVVYDSAQFSLLGTFGGSIRKVAYRPTGYSNPYPVYYTGVTISLSTTRKAVDALDRVFANNTGPDNTSVFSGNFTIGPGVSSPNVWPFQLEFTFSTPFFYNPTNGNLLIDIQIVNESGSYNGPLVESLGSVDSISSVQAQDYAYPGTMPTTGNASTLGVVTAIDVLPVIAPSPRISVTGSLTNLIIAGQGGAPGIVFFLLTTTNAATPLAEWQPIATNTFSSVGAFTLTNTTKSAAQQFYRLQIQ